MSKPKWYRMAKKAGRGEVLLYDEIDPWWGMSARTFREDLTALGRVEGIDLRVNSPGGAVFEGFAIYNALLDHPAPVTSYVDGVAASIASVVCMGGDEIVMADNAQMMIHNPWSFVMGDSDLLRRQAALLDSLRDASVRIYQRHVDLSDDELRALLDAETWLEADKAVELGFADRVVEAESKIAACVFDASKSYQHLPDSARKLFMMPAAPVAKEVAEVVEFPKADGASDERAAADAAAGSGELLAAEPGGLRLAQESIDAIGAAVAGELLAQADATDSAGDDDSPTDADVEAMVRQLFDDVTDTAVEDGITAATGAVLP